MGKTCERDEMRWERVGEVCKQYMSRPLLTSQCHNPSIMRVVRSIRVTNDDCDAENAEIHFVCEGIICVDDLHALLPWWLRNVGEHAGELGADWERVCSSHSSSHGRRRQHSVIGCVWCCESGAWVFYYLFLYKFVLNIVFPVTDAVHTLEYNWTTAGLRLLEEKNNWNKKK